jgi:CheY-like chemotaxis protein
MPGRVLVIEDDHETRESLRAVLESEGYQTLGAANGREALEVLAVNDQVSVILLDLTMPVMDGWQFRDAQRQNPSIALIPVIVVSVLATITDQADRLQAGAYVRKPVAFDELLSLVSRFCTPHAPE